MSKQKKQRFEGVVYSTDENFNFQFADLTENLETPANNKQLLKVETDRKMRKGKVVTIVRGFVGTENDLEKLAKMLKQKCGVGGSAKDHEIIVQGDFKEKIFDLLVNEGYKVKKVGG